MPRPVDVCSEHSIAFVRRFAKPRGVILEIGGGAGDLAARLALEGFCVTMIESCEESAAAARALGVDAYCAKWPEFSSPAVDCVLFTRSLHHIDDLDAALAAACRRLKAGGALLVEDFDFPAIDAATAEFLMERGKAAARNFDLTPESFLKTVAVSEDPVAAWSRDHAHDIHSFLALKEAADKQFGSSIADTTAYLFRYVAAALPDTVEAHGAVKAAYDAEVAAIDQGLIVPIGRRIVATV